MSSLINFTVFQLCFSSKLSYLDLQCQRSTDWVSFLIAAMAYLKVGLAAMDCFHFAAVNSEQRSSEAAQQNLISY